MARLNTYAVCPGGEFEEMSDPLVPFEVLNGVVGYMHRVERPPHRHNFHEIVWLQQGSATHLLDGDLSDLPAQTLLVIPRGRIHRFYPGEGCISWVLKFSDEFLLNPCPLLFSRIAGQTFLSLPCEHVEFFERVFALLLREYGQTAPDRLVTPRHLLAALIARMEELFLLQAGIVPHDYSRTLSIWSRFSELLEQRFRTHHAVSYYAAQLGLSPRRLGEVVRLYTGRYVSDVIDERLVVEAKRMILYSGRSIKEIAYELGFEEHSYFSKVFRKVAGTPPTSFKSSRMSAQFCQQ